MSIGYGGLARTVLQDEKTVVNEYSPYNLNEPSCLNNNCCFDPIREREDFKILLNS